ncbi:MAG: hypothetical protein ACTH6N_14505 [Brachybacterium tyrofermentans]|uniref:hypothetical protein n=1 Tax=Brachybacterium tyrofermentans TaxID=47848 RepID=UPI001866CFAC|nr:hypothetical protein [Brachybacterium tyrofermentans]
MTTEQRRALADTTPTTEVIRDAVTYPRDRLGEPLDISAERFDAWLAQVKRDAARAALDGLIEQEWKNYAKGADQCGHARHAAQEYRDTHYPEETP